jgi:hypothetical protein
MKAMPWIAAATAALALSAAAQLPEGDDSAFELVPYLGVATSPVGEESGRELELPRGIGLAVDYVDAASPAAGALHEGDVLHKLNDQLLVNHEQLAVLIRTYRAGDELKLVARREGRPVELTVKLAERRVRRRPLLRPGAERPPGLDLLSIPLSEDATNSVRLRLLQPGAGRLGGSSIRLHLGTQGSRSHRSSMLMDGKRVYSLEADGPKTNFHVATPDGEVLFDGPVNTAEERAKVPAEFQDPLQRLSPATEPTPDAPQPGSAVPVPGARSL